MKNQLGKQPKLDEEMPGQGQADDGVWNENEINELIGGLVNNHECQIQ